MKKNLIVYSTQYGCAAEVANKIAEQLEGETTVLNAKTDKMKNISEYDRIILGGSLYAGKVQKELKDFTAANKKALMEKPLGIYICGIGLTDTGIANSFEFSFEQDIREHAKIMDMVGGKLDFSKMSFMDKFIINTVTKKMLKYDKTDKLEDGQLPHNTLDEQKIAAIARVMNKY